MIKIIFKPVLNRLSKAMLELLISHFAKVHLKSGLSDKNWLIKAFWPDFSQSSQHEMALDSAIDKSISPSSVFLLQECRRREYGLKVHSKYEGKNRYLVEAKNGRKMAIFHIRGKIYLPDVNRIAFALCRNKLFTKTILAVLELPSSQYLKLTKATLAKKIREIDSSKTYVLKPSSRGGGSGVKLGIKSRDQCMNYASELLAWNQKLILEEFFEGRDIRVQAIDGKFFSATERLAGFVVGNGVYSIRQLIDEKNIVRIKNTPKFKIIIDAETLEILAKHGLGPDSVLENGRQINIKRLRNLTQGGDPVDVTALMHPTVHRMVEKICTFLRIKVCGIDILLKDLTSPLLDGQGVILEINLPTGLAFLNMVSAEKANAAGKILDCFIGETGQQSHGNREQSTLFTPELN